MNKLPAIRGDGFDENDLRVISMVSVGRLGSQALLPQDRIQSLIEAATDLSESKCSPEKAKELAAILFGCYPRAKIDNPDVYVRGIVTVLEKFPASISSQAVDSITLSTKFLPTRSEVYEAALFEFGELVKVKVRAEMMRDEHTRRTEEQKAEAERKQSRQDFRDKHGDKSPMDVLKAEGITIGESKRKKDK